MKCFNETTEQSSAKWFSNEMGQSVKKRTSVEILAAQPMQNESRIENNFHLNTKMYNTIFEVPNPLEAE